MIAREDSELCPWIFGIVNRKPHGAGDFLNSLADSALRADFDNYRVLRPALLALKEKYPDYCDPEAKPETETSPVDVRQATHVKTKEGVEKIASKYGIGPDGELAPPSKGGFGVVTESGRTVSMWEALAYFKEAQAE